MAGKTSASNGCLSDTAFESPTPATGSPGRGEQCFHSDPVALRGHSQKERTHEAINGFRRNHLVLACTNLNYNQTHQTSIHG